MHTRNFVGLLKWVIRNGNHDILMQLWVSQPLNWVPTKRKWDPTLSNRIARLIADKSHHNLASEQLRRFFLNQQRLNQQKITWAIFWKRPCPEEVQWQRPCCSGPFRGCVMYLQDSFQNRSTRPSHPGMASIFIFRVTLLVHLIADESLASQS